MRRVIFRPHPFCKLPHFLRLLPPLEREVLIPGRRTFITRHSVIQRRFDIIILRLLAAAAATVQSKSFAYVGPSDWTIPAPEITISVTYPVSSRRDDLRLSCLLTKTLMPVRPVREHCYLE